jgi:dephospho-CoA kinase
VIPLIAVFTITYGHQNKKESTGRLVKMPVIGITGGIATGKSVVARMFEELGAVTFSADDASREVMAPGSEVVRKVEETFGKQFVLPDGHADRTALAALVFSNAEAKEKLEKITHPAILELLKKRIEDAQRKDPDAFLVVEAPLLFEANLESWFDEIIVVATARRVQVERLLARNRLTPDEAYRRIESQMPLEEKMALADHVIRNDGPLEETRKQVESLWAKLKGGV